MLPGNECLQIKSVSNYMILVKTSVRVKKNILHRMSANHSYAGRVETPGLQDRSYKIMLFWGKCGAVISYMFLSLKLVLTYFHWVFTCKRTIVMYTVHNWVNNLCVLVTWMKSGFICFFVAKKFHLVFLIDFFIIFFLS